MERDARQPIIADYENSSPTTMYSHSTPSVGGDPNEQSGRVQAEHLIERGYEKLAFAHLRDARQDSYDEEGRERDVRAVCAERGPAAPIIIGTGIDLAETKPAREQLSTGRGVACCTDGVTISLLSAATSPRRAVPDEIGLIGDGHTLLSQATLPHLTTVTYDITAGAQNTVATALTALDGTDATPMTALDLRVVPGNSA